MRLFDQDQLIQNADNHNNINRYNNINSTTSTATLPTPSTIEPQITTARRQENQQELEQNLNDIHRNFRR